MTNELSAADAAKLFNSVSTAVRNEDSDKLSTLFAQETPEKEPEEEEGTPAEEPELEPEVPEHEPEQADDEPAEEAGSDEPEEEDPLKALRAEIEELKKLQHSLSSQAGRVPSLQRRLAEYDKQLAALRSATSSPTNKKSNPEIDEALKELENTDPILAATLRTVMEKAITGVDSTTTSREIERLQALREVEYAEYAQEQKNLLLSKYPNAAEVFKSEYWTSWKNEQPEHIKALASSDSAEAVIMALDLYKQAMLAKYPDQFKSTQQPAVGAQESNVNEAAKKIEEERKRQQAKAANVDNGKSPSRAKSPADPEALFKEFSESIRKERLGT